jgi:hypothetical protein
MNLAAADQIAKAVLYEGYMLYPYRPSSVKNRQRWNFGVLCPQSYCEAQKVAEAWTMQTECLVQCASETEIEVRIRFLQLVARSVGQSVAPQNAADAYESPDFRPVEQLSVDGRIYQPWQEAMEREVSVPVHSFDEYYSRQWLQTFTLPAEKQVDYVRDANGAIVGVIERERKTLCGTVEFLAEKVGEGIFRVRVRILNTTPFVTTLDSSRDEVLLSSLVSTHTVLGVENGTFVSLLAPEEPFADLAVGCENIGTWPVLVGEQGRQDTMLSSPIILYDYPQIAPESAGDLFDGTEIDEILSLRIMTLTDDEKREMSQSDERAREMLKRTESMPVEQLMKLHGVLRGLRPVNEESR